MKNVEISGVKTSVFACGKNGVKNGVEFFATMFSKRFFFHAFFHASFPAVFPPALRHTARAGVPGRVSPPPPTGPLPTAALTGGQGVLRFEVSGLPIVLELSRRRGLLAPLSVPIATSGLQSEQPL